MVSSLARAGIGATRARRRRGGIADSIFRDDDGDGWQDQRGAVAVGAAAGGQLWGRCRQHPASTRASSRAGAGSRFEGSAESNLKALLSQPAFF